MMEISPLPLKFTLKKVDTMDKDELIAKIREAVESDEDEICRCLWIQFLFDEYDRKQREISIGA